MKHPNILLASLLVFCSHQVWALPWLPTSTLHSSHEILPTKTGSIDFSGEWQGQCNNQPAQDLSIQQQADSIVLSYGFMKEKYRIGEIKSDTSSHKSQLDIGSNSVSWNTVKNALIFLNTQQFFNKEEHLNVFFSKVSMTLNAHQLIINGEYFQSTNELNDVERDIISCVYTRNFSKN